ncbi:hypothetical protein D3C80_581570 [compost metagenome]
MPSEISATVPSGLPSSASCSVRMARRRSGTSGFGSAAASLSRAADAVPAVGSLFVSAVKVSETGTSALSASSISMVAVSTRRSQSTELDQPLSMTSASGPLALSELARGFMTGSAIARMTAAASSMRRSVSHHGLWAGVSSRFRTVARMRSGGKISAFGRGGVTLSSHQMTGSDRSPKRISGLAKASAFMCGLPGMSRACRTVGCERQPAPLKRDDRCGGR